MPDTLFILNDPPYGTESSSNALRLAASLSEREGGRSCAKKDQKVVRRAAAPQDRRFVIVTAIMHRAPVSLMDGNAHDEVRTRRRAAIGHRVQRASEPRDGRRGLQVRIRREGLRQIVRDLAGQKV